MKILWVVDSPHTWRSGIWFHRNHLPSISLKTRGHTSKFMSLGQEVPDDFIDWADVAVFGRTYAHQTEPIKAMKKFKEAGKRVVYDIDDDLWGVNPENPSVMVSSAYKDQYEGMIRESDTIITPSSVLLKKIKSFWKNKTIHICPNMVSKDYYRPRPKDHDELIIGYAGASSHWKDIQIIIEPLQNLQKKYKFFFTLQGMTSGPLEGEMYVYDQLLKRNLQPERSAYFKEALGWYNELKDLKMFHIPFYPPELYPTALSRADFDIGLAPLDDNEFNTAKSCIKFYEYAAVGTVTLASDILPYKAEVNYLAKNTKKDWEKKLERLIADPKFREKKLKQQMDWVMKNRTIEAVALSWELALQRPGGLKVRSQNG